MIEKAIELMFEELDAFLAAKPIRRLYLVHGYELDGVTVQTHPYPVVPSRRRERADVSLRLPIVWEVEPGSIPARASDTPTTEEPDRLHRMLQNYVDAGGLDSAGVVELSEWRLERPADELPSRGTAQDTHWTVHASFIAD